MKRRTRKKAKQSLRLVALLALLGVGIRGMFWMFPAMNTFFYNLTVFSAATLMPQGGAQMVKDALAPAGQESSSVPPEHLLGAPNHKQSARRKKTKTPLHQHLLHRRIRKLCARMTRRL